MFLNPSPIIVQKSFQVEKWVIRTLKLINITSIMVISCNCTSYVHKCSWITYECTKVLNYPWVRVRVLHALWMFKDTWDACHILEMILSICDQHRFFWMPDVRTWTPRVLDPLSIQIAFICFWPIFVFFIVPDTKASLNIA